MRKTLLSLAVLGALNFVGQPLAHATPNIFGSKLSIGYIGYHLHYKEDITPSDKDTAWMNGVKVTYRRIQQEKGLLGYPYLRMFFMYASSGDRKGNYNGYSQYENGHFYPSSTDTTESIERYEGDVGYVQVSNQKIVTRESLYIGEQWWTRDIKNGTDSTGNPVKGYEEDYGNMYAGLRLEADYFFADDFYVGLSVGGAISPKIKAINQMYNKYLGEIYKMGTAYRWDIELPISYTAGRFSFNLTGFYSGWKFNKSETKTVIDEYGNKHITWEPSSKTEETGFCVSIAYRF